MATAIVSSEAAPRRWRLPERLPDLRGKWLIAYSVLWAAALLIAIAAPISTTVINYRGLGHPVWRPHGLVTNTTDAGITVAAVFGEEARRAGVRVGDQVIAIDGWPVAGRQRDDHIDKLLDGPEGSSNRLRLRSPSATEREVTLATRASTAAEYFRGTGVSRPMFDAAIHFFDVAFLLFLVPAGVLLFLLRRREIIPALLSMSFLVLSGFVSGERALTNAGFSGAFVDTTADLLGWMPLVLALVTFPDGRLVSKWAAAAPILAGVAALNDAFFGVRWVDELALGLAFLIAGTALVLRYRRLPSGAGRQQLRWAFLGFFAGISLLLIVVPLIALANQLRALDPRWMVWFPVAINILAGLSFPCMALGLLVSVLRYRLYDADTIIGRSAAYGVLTLGFVALFAGSEKLAELIGEKYFEHSIGIAAGAVGAAVAAACIVPPHNRVHRWAERRFQKPLIRLREGLPACVADLRDTASVGQIAEAAMKRVEAGVRSTREAVLLGDGQKCVVAGARRVAEPDLAKWRLGWAIPAGEQALDCDRKDPLFPLRVRLCIETADEPETIGWLLLGPRPDGSFFGKDEREALEHVGGPLSLAIHVAQLREQREQRAQAQYTEAEARLGALEQIVVRLSEKLGFARSGGTPSTSG
jgi:hypothetical protein